MSVTGYLFPEVTLAQAMAWNYFMQCPGATCFHAVVVEGIPQFILVAKEDQEEELTDEMKTLCRLLKLSSRKTLVTIHASSKYVEF
jgi:hypothetical protein